MEWAYFAKAFKKELFRQRVRKGLISGKRLDGTYISTTPRGLRSLEIMYFDLLQGSSNTKIDVKFKYFFNCVSKYCNISDGVIEK